jgi:hypothetical protein
MIPLLNEDYINGISDFKVVQGNWEVTQDVDGNSVLEIDNLISTNSQSINCGHPKWTNFTLKFSVANWEIKPDKWYSFRIVTNNNHISIFVDGILAIESDLPSTIPGNFSFGTGSNSDVLFDDVSIYQVQ